MSRNAFAIQAVLQRRRPFSTAIKVAILTTPVDRSYLPNLLSAASKLSSTVAQSLVYHVDPKTCNPLPSLIKLHQRHSFTHWLGVHSSEGRSILPALSALLPGSSAVADVTEIDGDKRFRRPIYAGTCHSTLICDRKCGGDG